MLMLFYCERNIAEWLADKLKRTGPWIGIQQLKSIGTMYGQIGSK
jgi:hypothetical protein